MQLKKIAFTLLIGAAAAMAATSPSFAAKKKAMAWCFQQQTPVCATRGGLKMTYASACFAEKDGAKVVSQGACKPAKKMSMKKSSKKKK